MLAAGAFGWVSSAAAGTEQDRDARRVADTLLAALIEANGAPGMSAALARDGEILWLGAAGFRDLEQRLPVRADTTFRFASVSKLVTATAAMKLAQQGRLDLDAPVRTIVPYLPAAWPAISARQLAAHTSGIPHYQDVDAGRGGVRYGSVADAVGVFSRRELLSPPGARYHYSSFGFTLLSAVVEESAGQPFLDFVRRSVVDGLDIQADLGADPNAAVAYAFVGSGVERAPPHDYSYSWGGAGFRGSARDLARFGADLLSGKRLSPAARELMWAPSRTDDGAAVMERDAAVGFGWRIGRDWDGARIIHHAGVAEGARSALVLYPERGESVSLLSNIRWTASIEQTAMMLAAPFQAQPAAPGGAPPCPLAATRFEGRFGDQPISGLARFELERGLCRGRLSAANPFGVWLNAFPQADAAQLQIIAVAADGGLARAALVTPAGLYDLRAKPDQSHEARIVTGRLLTITFR